MTKKIRTIQILRIIACMGVFGGHFLGLTFSSEMSTNFLKLLRNGWTSNTVLSYLYQGDTNVIIFYILGGFFLVYTLKNIQRIEKICIKLIGKIVSLLVPAAIIIIFTAVIYKVENNCGNYRLLFDSDKLKGDLKQLVIPGEEMYYAYQLWYIRDMLRCYVLGTIVYLWTRKTDTRLKYPIYIGCLAILFVLQSTAYFSALFGMVIAELGNDVITKKKKVRNSFGIALLLFILAPFVYNEHHLNNINKMILTIVISWAIFFLFVTDENTFESGGNIINWFDENSYAFYLVHVLVLKVASYPLYKWMMLGIQYESIVLIINYIVSVFLCWMIAFAFNNIIIKKIRQIFYDINRGLIL